MKKIILMSLIMAFDQSIHAGGVIKNFAKVGVYGIGLNGYAFISCALTELVHNARSAYVDKHALYLNDHPDYANTIQELHNTYSPKQTIKIYAYKPDKKEEINRDDIGACALPNHNKIFLYNTVRDVLKDQQDPLHFLAKGVVGHEMGHVVQNHHNKTALFTAVISLSTFYATHKLLQSPIIKKQRKYYLLTFTGAFTAKNLLDMMLIKAYDRSQEREADIHMATHTKDVRILKDIIKKHNEFEPDSSLLKIIIADHPQPAERSAYIKKILKELEANSAKTN